MRSAVVYLLGLLPPEVPAFLSLEDLDGPHAAMIRKCQSLGFIAEEPVTHPVPSCPYCREGTPYRLGRRFVCGRCLSTVDDRHMAAWPVYRESFYHHLAQELRLHPVVRMIDDCLCRLGVGMAEGRAVECFVYLGGSLSEAARRELNRYVRVLTFHAPGADRPDAPGKWYPLIELFDANGVLTPPTLDELIRERGAVRFDESTGVLRVGGTIAGEVAVGSKECFFLSVLARDLDRLVSYADIKRDVLRLSGSQDTTDEATFCQKLKSRVKKTIPEVDRLIVTTNKGDGYRLRAEGEL